MTMPISQKDLAGLTPWGIAKKRRLPGLTYEEAQRYGIDIPEGWSVKFDYGTNGDEGKDIFVSPDKWEYRDLVYGDTGELIDYAAISPEGVAYNKIQLLELEKQQEQATVIREQEIATFEPYLTPEGSYDIGAARAAGISEDVITRNFGEIPVGEQVTKIPEIEIGTQISIKESLRTVFPDYFVMEGTFGAFGEESPENVIKQVSQLAVENPQAFFTQVVAKGRTPETEAIINAFFETTPQSLDQVFSIQTGEEDTRVSPPALIDVVVDGTVVRKEGVLDASTNVAYDLRGNRIGVFNNMTGKIEDRTQEDIFKDISDTLHSESRRLWENFENWQLTKVPWILYPKMKGRVKPGSFTAFLDEANKQMREKYRLFLNENKEEYDQWVKSNPDLAADAKYVQGPIDNPEILKDPRYYAYELSAVMPFILAIAGTTALTGGTGLPAVLASTAVMTPLEGQSIYEDLVNAGAPEDMAHTLSIIAGGIIGALEHVGRIPFLKRVAPGIYKKFTGKAGSELAKRTVRETIKKFGKDFTIIQFSEVATEVAQEIVGNVAVSIYDENRGWFDNLSDIAVKTFVATLAFGGGGAAISARPTIAEEVATGIEERIKEGLETPERGAIVPGAEPGGDVTPRIQEIDQELAKLQTRYEKMMNEPQGARPPSIQKDRLAGIAKQMDKLDAEREKLVSSQLPTEPAQAKAPVTPEVTKPKMSYEEWVGEGRVTKTAEGGEILIIRFETEEEAKAWMEARGLDTDTTDIQVQKEHSTGKVLSVSLVVTSGRGLEIGQQKGTTIRKRVYERTNVAIPKAEVTPSVAPLTLEPQLGEKLPVPEVGEDVGLQADIFGGLTEVKTPPVVVAEEIVTPSPSPPIQLPKTVEVPKPPASPNRRNRIVAQSQEIVKQDRPGALNRFLQRIPVIGRAQRFERPAIEVSGTESENLLVAQVAEVSALADVNTKQIVTRLPLFKMLSKVFGEGVLQGGKSTIEFIGTAEQSSSPITGTLLDIVQNPQLYKLTPSQESAIEAINYHNDTTLDYVVNEYGAEIGRFAPNPGGAFLSNVDVSEDIIEWLGSETRAIATGRGKTRIWNTARDRLGGKTKFTPELDVKKLIEGMDAFKSSAAAGVTFKEVVGGLTRLEAMEETHPELYTRMIALRKELQSLRNSLSTLNQKLTNAIDGLFESSYEDSDLSVLQDSLDVQLERGPRTGLNIAAIQAEMDLVKEKIKELRPAWKSANLKPYVFVQQGLYRYFTADQAKYVIQSRQMTNNPVLRFIERWRAGAFSGDFSPFAIQGMIGVQSDPLGSFQSFAGGVIRVFKTGDFLHSITVDGLMDDIIADPESFAEFSSLMGRQLSGTPAEYSAGFLSMIPGFDKFTETTYVTVTRGTYNLWTRTYKRLMESGMPEIEAKVAAIEMARKVYPLVSPAKLGQSQKRAALLRALPTSYSFIRQPASLMAQASMGYAKMITGQKLSPQERLAARHITILAGSVAATSVASAVASAIAMGKDDDEIKQAAWDAINPDPYNGKFLSLIVGEFRIPLGGPYRAIFRAIYPQEVEGIPFPVPFAGILYWNKDKGHPDGFIWNRITPGIKTQINLFLVNEDYYGDAIIKGEFPENIIRALLYELEGAVPLSIGEAMGGIRREEWPEEIAQQATAQFVGVNLMKLDNTYFHKLVRNLGLPTTEDQLPYTDERGYFTLKDIYGKVTSVLSDTTVEEIAKRKGYPSLINTIMEARDLKREIDLLPNYSPVSLDQDKYKDYYNQWSDRQQLISEGDEAVYTKTELFEGKYRVRTYTGEDALKKFDQDYPQAELGNMSQSQYVLLGKYWNTTPEGRPQFLKDNPSIGIIPRRQYYITHPMENAQLALWGQAKILTEEAYNEYKKLISDYPATAIPPNLLPPEGSIETHFQREQMVSEGTESSAAGKLLLLEDYLNAQENEVKSYAEWHDPPLVVPNEQVEYYQFQVDNQALYDDIDTIRDNDKLTEKEKEAAYAEVRVTKVGDETFGDIERRVIAMGKGTREVPISPEIVNSYVKHMQTVDETSGNSAEAKLNRYDNPDLNAFLMSEDYWGKSAAKALDEDPAYLDNYLVPRWRMDVQYRAEDEAYNAIKTTAERQGYLENNEAYRMDRRRREALSMTNTATGERFPIDQVEPFVEYHELTIKGKRQERYLVDNPGFALAMHDIGGIDIPLANEVPDVAYDDIYDEYQEDFDKIAGFADNQSDYYIEKPEPGLTLDETRGKARDALRFDENGKMSEFGLAELERDAHAKFVPQGYVDAYVGYYTIEREGKGEDYKDVNGTDLWYEHEWFMQENTDFYRDVYIGLLENNPLDFKKVPTRKVFDKYVEYQHIDSRLTTKRQDFRWINPDLEAWLLLTGKVTKSIYDQKRAGAITPGEKRAIDIREIEDALRDNP